MKKFEKNLMIIESNHFNVMSDEDLKYLTGGQNTSGAGGSQTSNTYKDNSTTCCDATCVCTCVPPAKLPVDPKL